jgi:nucleotide-binding universal stress UspA family protein
VALAETYQMKLRTAVRSDVTPEEAIMKETERRKHNFIIMGAGRRPGEKLFFGDTVAVLLEKSQASLLLVAS